MPVKACEHWTVCSQTILQKQVIKILKKVIAIS